jgi:23S rRNA pseudouridine2605 synthase
MTQARKGHRIGLARALSKLGFCSRSQAAELIHSGHVRLNGNLRRDPETPVRFALDHIAVDGRTVEALPTIYLMMNKPRGLVTTASDEKGRDTIYSVLSGSAENLPWLAAVGRLDKASEGLLLLTNDCEWGARIASPETHLEKTYHVQIGTLADETLVQAIRCGVRVKSEILRTRQVRLLRSGEKNCWLEITLDQGKNRHIRRMLDALGIPVLRLVRVAIGPLQLGDLPKGFWRRLTKEEKLVLDQALNNQLFRH